jgi:allantoinase
MMSPRHSTPASDFSMKWQRPNVRSLVLRGGTVIDADGRVRADVRIDGEHIVDVSPDLADGNGDEIDASGLFIFPGVIDVHLHFNEPGRAEWEGAATGSRALAAGGGTMFFDMPLNSTPCTVNAHEVDRKRTALEDASVTDFALWGGLVPGSVREMAEMADRGVVGFKAFMCDSGLPEFPRADDNTLRDGLAEAARLGLPVAVHAESEDITRSLLQTFTGTSVGDFLASRPVAAEVEAIGRAVKIAEETGAKLHLVHVSSGSGVAKALEGRARGVDVSIETCPHYLFFTEHDLHRLDVVAKCAPPLRDADEHGKLWQQLLNGSVDIIASDHSPCDPALKKRGDFRGSWGGIAGVQSTLAVVLERGHDGRRLRFERIASLLATRPAQRFGISGKGSVTVGNDADLVLLDPSADYTLEAGHLQQRHKISPYLGAMFGGVVRRTLRRGETIFLDGTITAATKGKYVRPRH